MKRRTVALFMAVVLCAALFAGCSGDTTAETTAPDATTAPDTTAIEATTQAPKNMEGYVFSFINGGKFNPDGTHKGTLLGEELEDIYADIEITHNCSIRFIDGSNELEAILPAITAGGKYADFIRARQFTWIPLIVNNALRPFDTDEMVEAGLDVNDSDCFHQQFTHLSDFTINGETHTYGLDMSGKYERMSFGHTYAFNKTLLNADGYTARELFDKVYAMEWTYDYMIEIAEFVSKDTDNDGQFDVWGVALDCDGNEIWTNGTGPIIYDETTGKYKANCTDPNVITSLEYMAKLNQDGKVSPTLLGTATMGRSARRTLFYTGKAAFAGLYGPNFGKDGETNGTANMADDAGLLPIPKGPNANHYTMNFVDTDLFVMLATTTEWQKAAYIMGKISQGVHDDQEYLDYLAEEAFIGCEDSYIILTEYLLPNGLMNIAKCSWDMYDITRMNFYKSVYEGSMTPIEAAETYQPQVQNELNKVFKQE